MDQTNPVAEMKAKEPARIIYRYTIPADAQKRANDGVKSIGLVKVTVGEELIANKLAHGDDGAGSVELLKMSLREVNGLPVNVADGSAETALNKMDPIVRGLVVVARTRLHQPNEKEVADFLGSATTAL